MLTVGDESENNTLQTSLIIEILPYPFTDLILPNITATVGERFHFSFTNCTNLSPFFINYEISTTEADWIHIDSSVLEIGGLVPSREPSSNIFAINLTTMTSTNFAVSTTFFLHLIQEDHSNTTHSSIARRIRSGIVFLAVLPVVIVSSCILAYRRQKFRRSAFRSTEHSESGASPSSPYPSFDEAKQENEFSVVDVQALQAEDEAVNMGGRTLSTVPSTHSPNHRSIRRINPEGLSKQHSTINISSAYTVPAIKEASHRECSGYGDQEARVENTTSMMQMPSMNFALFLSPDLLSATSKSDSRNDNESEFTIPQLGSGNASPKSRSVNSAYDSLPSWDSESTWHHDRRRRPPSPAWRRDDIDRGVTLYDKMREETSTGTVVKLGS